MVMSQLKQDTHTRDKKKWDEERWWAGVQKNAAVANRNENDSENERE